MGVLVEIVSKYTALVPELVEIPCTRVLAGYHSSIDGIFTSVWWCTNVAIV